MSLETIKIEAQKAIGEAPDLKTLQEVFKKYLDKKGELTQVLRSLEGMPKAERAKIGKEANDLKVFLQKKIEEKKSSLADSSRFAGEAGKEEWLDVTAPGKKITIGHSHPLAQVKRKIEEIFGAMGFTIVDGPEVETEWYNFDALNFLKDHPSRDAWDTFYLKNGLLLRTHTTPVDVRFMEKNRPPLRIIIPGRIFRHEATDASHETNFYQVDGLMVGKDISVANFKAVIQEFFKRFFGKPVATRLRSSFFPFTEPSFEIDMKGEKGWLEVMGAGMIHPNVLKAAGLNPKDWQGFAFGMGMDRLAMMKYKINDIRLLYSGDLRFLNQF